MNCDHCKYLFHEDSTCRKHAPTPDNNTILIESKQEWRAIWPRIEDASVDWCGEFESNHKGDNANARDSRYPETSEREAPVPNLS